MFLEVKMEHDINTGLLEMKQTGLIERVVEALGLDDDMLGVSIHWLRPSLSSRMKMV